LPYSLFFPNSCIAVSTATINHHNFILGFS
jgi:hypothetical protein